MPVIYDFLRDGPLEMLWGWGLGGQSKKKIMQGKITREYSCTARSPVGKNTLFPREKKSRKRYRRRTEIPAWKI